MDKKVIREALEKGNYIIIEEKRYKNYAWRFKLSNGTSVFCGDAGNIWSSGKYKDAIEAYIKPLEVSLKNNRVFIVYGHDLAVKEDLEALLSKWSIESLAIDALPTQGRTIIEQLEHYIPRTNFGIVLMTPDDIGYLVGHEEDAKYRARQNVIFELGLLFAKLGRSRVAVIMKRSDEFEKPSDISGLIIIEYTSSINEITIRLKKELNSHGYSIK